MRRFLLIFICFIMIEGCTMAEDPLAPFENFMGTWTGTTADGSGTDIMMFERMDDGRVRHRHALGDGSYGGVPLYSWGPEANEGRGSIIYHYTTTSAHQTQGIGSFDGEVFTAFEEVTGHATITAVRSHMELVDGVIVSSSEVLNDGEWQPGPGFNYHSTPDAVIPLNMDEMSAH